MTADTFLFNTGWFFFAAYTIVVAGVTVAAFGRSLFPSKAQRDPAQTSPTADLSRSSDSRAR